MKLFVTILFAVLAGGFGYRAGQIAGKERFRYQALAFLTCVANAYIQQTRF